MPKIQFCSNAKPSMYAYPEALQPPKKEEKEKVQMGSFGHLFDHDYLKVYFYGNPLIISIKYLYTLIGQCGDKLYETNVCCALNNVLL